MIKYDEEYYKTVNYVDYMTRGERYAKTAFELADLLTKLNLINRSSQILDYGCAVGFLVNGFHKIGYEETYGYDISEWAKNQAKELVGEHGIINDLKQFPLKIDIIISLDVFEHMTDKEIAAVFQTVKSDVLIVRIPVSTDNGKSFHLEVSNKDKTHINCKTKEKWIRFLKQFGYKNCFKLNLLTIYDSDGVFCGLFTKG